MMDRNNRPEGRRPDDDMLRRMLFGGNGSGRGNGVPQARPAMEPVTERQSAGWGGRGNGRTPEVAGECLDACSLAMVYSPKQEWQNLFSCENALSQGTLFEELAKPFNGRAISCR